MNDNQNAFVTRSTSRVLAEPGGKSSVGDAARIKQKNESQHFSIFGARNDIQAPKESSNAFASSATTNSYNVLTDRPTSRVLRPPGGQSSIKLG
eukprot:scaffold25049_cov110-Skeletonema_marinoi.AAC.2